MFEVTQLIDFVMAHHLWALAFVPAALVALYARWRFSRTYAASSKITLEGKPNGAKAARILLDRNGMANVELYETPSTLTDHYDPRRRCVFLSTPIADNRSVAALGMAAHVVAHAIQFKREHRYFRLRMTLIASTGWITNSLLVALVLGWLSEGNTRTLFVLGAATLYLAFTVGYLMSMTVEYDASRLARRELERNKLIQESELPAMNRMLSAAAWLDVPGLLLAYLGLFRLFRPHRHGVLDD